MLQFHVVVEVVVTRVPDTLPPELIGHLSDDEFQQAVSSVNKAIETRWIALITMIVLFLLSQVCFQVGLNPVTLVTASALLGVFVMCMCYMKWHGPESAACLLNETHHARGIHWTYVTNDSLPDRLEISSWPPLHNSQPLAFQSVQMPPC